MIENVSVFNRGYVQENTTTVNSTRKPQVQAYTEGQK